MKETDLADVLCVSSRKLRELRQSYLTEGQHWDTDPVSRVVYTDAGIREMEAALGLQVGTVSKQLALSVAERVQDALDATPEPSFPEEPASKGACGQPARGNGGVCPMVTAAIVRTLPNARVYVAQVVGTKRILRLRTKARLGLKKGRRLLCMDLGEELVFDRTAARMFGRNAVATTAKEA